MVEQEYWTVVSELDSGVVVEYGADLHCSKHGSGFPRINTAKTDEEKVTNSVAATASHAPGITHSRSSAILNAIQLTRLVNHNNMDTCKFNIFFLECVVGVCYIVGLCCQGCALDGLPVVSLCSPLCSSTQRVAGT